MTRRKKFAPSQQLALFFWTEILEEQRDPWRTTGFRRYLGEASRVIKQFDDLDIDALRSALETMKDDGLFLRSKPPGIWSAMSWKPRGESQTYYEIAVEGEEAPPIYDVWAIIAQE